GRQVPPRRVGLLGCGTILTANGHSLRCNRMRRTTANPPVNSLPGKAKPIAGRPWSKKSAAWSGRDGGQFRRKREADVLADQVEIALVRETKLRQTLADLLDEHLRRRSPRGEADATNIVEPRG